MTPFEITLFLSEVGENHTSQPLGTLPHSWLGGGSLRGKAGGQQDKARFREAAIPYNGYYSRLSRSKREFPEIRYRQGILSRLLGENLDLTCPSWVEHRHTLRGNIMVDSSLTKVPLSPRGLRAGERYIKGGKDMGYGSQPVTQTVRLTVQDGKA